MKSDANSSAPISGTTSGSPAPTTESEDEFLARQAADAAKAIPALFNEFRDNALATLDPRLWTKDHPWASIGVAVAGAFTATSVLIPSKKQSANRMREHFSPEPPETNSPGKMSMMQKLLQEAVKIGRPVIANALTAFVKCKTTPEADHDGNGHHPVEE